jgi:hypothetical protein
MALSRVKGGIKRGGCSRLMIVSFSTLFFQFPVIGFS